MPIYSIQNKDTEEVFEVNMPYSELAEYLEQNPQHIQIFNKFPGFGDPVRLGRKKVDDGFKEVLNRAKNSHLHSTVNTM